MVSVSQLAGVDRYGALLGQYGDLSNDEIDPCEWDMYKVLRPDKLPKRSAAVAAPGS